MKNLKILFNSWPLALLLILLLNSITLFAQSKSSIIGKVIESKNNEPVPFATISLFDVSDTLSKRMRGTVSDVNGNFTIDQIQNGKYYLRISSIGFKTATKTFSISSAKVIDAGIFSLQDSIPLMNEIVITTDRIKGKSETDKTIYFINKKILSATGNSSDLLRHIPGLQVDLKQNISIDGNPNILLFVDGKKRGKSFINQLNPSQIDKVEVIDTPPLNYEGNASGVINIVLKKEKPGVSGHVFSELPTSKSVVYSFPTFSLNYSQNKVNLNTSYNGEINYENISEITNRKIFESSSITDISSIQQARQKNLFHKFHYGIDYHLSDRDIINYYGFFNQYSYEQDGDVSVEASGSVKEEWKAQKKENDLNRSIFNSLYYKHLFNDKGKEITIDISNVYNRSENHIAYMNNTGNESLIYTNTQNPKQVASSMRVDYSTPFHEKIKLNAGVKVKIRDMGDSTSNGFSYNEQIYALYGALKYQKTNFDFNTGLRVENAKTEINKGRNNSLNSFLPYAAFHYKVNKRNDLYLSYRSSVNRPSVYLLNQYTYTDNPYSIRKGNPLLTPEMRNRLQLEHTISFKSNYISSRLFYETISNVINSLTYLNERNLFETQFQNLGSIHQYGLQLTGALKIGMLAVSSSFRLYNQSIFRNSLAKKYITENKNNLVFESDISGIVSLKNDFALSVIFQYETAKANIQDNMYDEPLYFISLDKTFKKNLKIGIVSALPFAKDFTYQGSDIHAPDFSSSYSGNLKLPTIPLMFRISYQFGKEMSRANIKREKEKVNTRTKQGF